MTTRQDELRWERLKIVGDQNLRSNPSYSKDAERESLGIAINLEKQYLKELNEARKDGKAVTPEQLYRLKQLEVAAKASKEAFLRNDFRYRFPSSTVNTVIYGDAVYAERFNGEAKSLLYNVKNMMKQNELGQLQGTRTFNDGTVITAASHFGQDSIIINTTKATIAEGTSLSCKLTLINVPPIVQPMRYPGVIGRGQVGGNGYPDTYHFPTELIGTDYIKTYYEFEATSGLDEEWLEGCTPEICLEKINSTPPVLCSPFRFDDSNVPHAEERITCGATTRVGDPLNHCFESIASCFGDIIESGSDSGGDYVIWKVYSEYACWAPTLYQLIFQQSRTGYGIFRLKVAFKDKSGREVCTAYQDVVMDCCQKDSSLRVPELFWDFNECQYQLDDFPYGGGVICRAPVLVDSWAIWRWGYQYFYNLPEITGACLPYTWTLTGPGYLACGPSKSTKQIVGVTSVTYMAPEDIFVDATCSPARLKVTDRCGRSDEILISCCDAAPPTIEMSYTSLQMFCGDTQTLHVIGGCPPYTWETNFGSFTYWDEGGWPFRDYVTFNAPGTNPQCASNPTVKVRDCCGKEASATFAVNCVVTGWDSMIICYCTVSNCSAKYCLDEFAAFAWGLYYTESWVYKCDGTLGTHYVYNDMYNWGYSGCGIPGCYPGLELDMSCCPEVPCGAYPGYPCNSTTDLRSEWLKEQGCCPLNLLTGLPS